MNTKRFIFAWSALLGSLIWIGVWVTLGLMEPAPPGGYRDGATVVHPYIVAATALILIGHVGLYLKQRSGLGLIGTGAFLLSLLGMLLIGGARLAQELGFDPQPWAGVGWVLQTVSLLVYSIVTLWKRKLPRSIGIALLIAALSQVFVNDMDHRAWLGVPYGLSWIWIGCYMLRKPRNPQLP